MPKCLWITKLRILNADDYCAVLSGGHELIDVGAINTIWRRKKAIPEHKQYLPGSKKIDPRPIADDPLKGINIPFVNLLKL